MPGICAIASQLAPADTSPDLAEMLGRTRHHPWYREDRFSDPERGISLGRVSLGFNDLHGRYHDNHLGKGRRHEHDPLWLRVEVVRIVVD